MPDTQLDDTEDEWVSRDPHGYFSNADDRRRVEELLAILPSARYRRAIDLGSGNGFLTAHLPADEVIGIEVSPRAIDAARQYQSDLWRDRPLTFVESSIWDAPKFVPGPFDLIVATGSLYKRYLGNNLSWLDRTIRALAAPAATLVTCHVAEWPYWLPTATEIDRWMYPYRSWQHELVVQVLT